MELAYQPMYRLADSRLIAAEALLRWTNPTFGSVSPAEFIPLAEETGQIVALGDWVLTEAVRAMAEWELAGKYLHRLLVNVSARQLTDTFVEHVAAVLTEHGVTASRITLEVTESHLADLKITDTLHQLHALGVGIALDDFGTGYSSLAQLARLPVDVLKIDRQFIADRETGPDILRVIVSLAATLKMATVAEGIETEEQLQLATSCGVTYGQGFLLARPMPRQELATKLEAVTRSADGSRAPLRLPAQRPDQRSPENAPHAA